MRLGGYLDAQFFLDSSQLLAQVKLFLRAVYLRAYAAADSRLQFEYLYLVAHDHANFLKAFQWIERFQQVLLLVGIGDNVCCQHVGKPCGSLNTDDGVDILYREAAIELGVAFKEANSVTHQRIGLRATMLRLLRRIDAHAYEWLQVEKLVDLHAAQAIQQYLHAAILLVVDRGNFDECTDRVNIFGLRVIDLGVALRGGDQCMARSHHRLFNGTHGSFTRDGQRHASARKHNHIL